MISLLILVVALGFISLVLCSRISGASKLRNRTNRFSLLSIQIGILLLALGFFGVELIDQWGDSVRATTSVGTQYNISLDMQNLIIAISVVAFIAGGLMALIGALIRLRWTSNRDERRQKLKETDGVPVKIQL